MPTINGEVLNGNGGSPLEQPKAQGSTVAGWTPVWSDKPKPVPTPRLVSNAR